MGCVRMRVVQSNCNDDGRGILRRSSGSTLFTVSIYFLARRHDAEIQTHRDVLAVGADAGYIA